MNNFKIIHIGKFFFWLSFLAGNVALFGYLLTKNEAFASFGFFVLIFGTILNLLVFASLLIYGYIKKPFLNDCIKSASLLLINIPIAVLYAAIGLNVIL